MNAFEIGDQLRLSVVRGIFQQQFAITDDVIQRCAKVVFEIVGQSARAAAVRLRVAVEQYFDFFQQARKFDRLGIVIVAAGFH